MGPKMSWAKDVRGRLSRDEMSLPAKEKGAKCHRGEIVWDECKDKKSLPVVKLIKMTSRNC